MEELSTVPGLGRIFSTILLTALVPPGHLHLRSCSRERERESRI
jgi:hypothetical protein